MNIDEKIKELELFQEFYLDGFGARLNNMMNTVCDTEINENKPQKQKKYIQKFEEIYNYIADYYNELPFDKLDFNNELHKELFICRHLIPRVKECFDEYLKGGLGRQNFIERCHAYMQVITNEGEEWRIKHFKLADEVKKEKNLSEYVFRFRTIHGGTVNERR